MALTRLRICKYISFHLKHACSASRVCFNRTSLSYYLLVDKEGSDETGRLCDTYQQSSFFLYFISFDIP